MNQIKRQIQEAEELFGKVPKRSFAQQLFMGKFDAYLWSPYPSPEVEEQKRQDEFLEKVRSFLSSQVDAAKIDREASIPNSVIRGLFDLKVMSMSIPEDHGGLGFSQYAYCKVMEEIGGTDSSLSILVNAHQSIGLKSLLLFGTPEQKATWLPKLAKGEVLAAFALTEPNAGSDAGGIETRAVLNAEGTHYVINGEKQWITNGSTAGFITVMAKVPNTKDKKGREQITAFIVTPDMPGFEIKAAALEKCGIRGTVTSKLLFKDLRVPVSNVIGSFGQGLRLALTVLDFGRTTFGASCTGAAKHCLRDAIERTKTRRQFGKALIEFELVKAKIARMAALTFAMESGTYLTAQLIDRHCEDYMVETAMLKVFASDSLWEIVNETIQIFGGSGYFTDLPYERMMRDARINLIGEGANDVLRTFIALVGMRTAGYELQELLHAFKSPLSGLAKAFRFAQRQLFSMKQRLVPIYSSELSDLKKAIEKLLRLFRSSVTRSLVFHRERILEKQYIQKRIADSATELFMMSAVLSRLDTELQRSTIKSPELSRDLQTGRYYFLIAEKRIRTNLAELSDHFDHETTALADQL